MKRGNLQRTSFLLLFAVISLAIFPAISLPIFVTEAKAQQTNPVRYWAVIVAGDDSGVQSFPRDANYMFHVLNVHYCFDGIRYLGVDTSYAGVDGEATKDNVRNTIEGWLANNSDINDVIFIFFSCHGGGYDCTTALATR